MNAEQKTLDVVATRYFNVASDQVWKAWSEADLVMRWWGPTGFTSPICKMDFRVGGTSLVCMRSPEGYDMYNTWTYQKIVPTQRIEFILNFADKDGNKQDPAAMGMPPGIPQDVPHVITFKPVSENETEMTVTEHGYTTEQVVELSQMGLEQVLDKMVAIFATA